MDKLNHGLLPSDVKVVPYIDRTNLIHTTIHTIPRTLVEGLILVTVVVLLFVGSVRGALLIALTIPLSLLFAFVCMHLTNIPANLLSLGAIDFGIIVDGSIVLVETILQAARIASRRGAVGERRPDRGAAGGAADLLRHPRSSSLATSRSSRSSGSSANSSPRWRSPLATPSSARWRPRSWLMPGLAYAIYRKPGHVYDNRVLDRITTAYKALLQKRGAQPRLAIIPGAIAAVLAIVLGATLGRDFLPYLDEGSIWLQVEMPPGISMAKGSEMAAELRSVVRDIPGSLVRRDPAGPQRGRHRSLDPVTH